jgi:UPF0716 family protein affecting phage T7 exclusion
VLGFFFSRLLYSLFGFIYLHCAFGLLFALFVLFTTNSFGLFVVSQAGFQ